jgi:predicted MFS family arabinose efflux permease
LRSRLRFQVLAFTGTRTVLNTMHRMVYPLLPAFQRGLGVDLAALSLALTLRSLAGASGPLLASVADSRGRKAGMMVGLLLFVAGVGLVAVWPTYQAFLIALVLAMVGKYIFDPSMQAYLGDRVAYQRRGLVLAVTEIGWSLSFIFGVPLMGLLIAAYGWAAPFPLFALLGLLAFGLLGWLLPGDPAPADGRVGLLGNMGLVWARPAALAGLSMSLLISAANEVINLVFGVWLEDSFGLKITALGAVAIVIGLSELGGESLVGGLTDRLGKVRSLTIGLLLNSVAALTLAYLGQNTIGALVGLFLFYITFEFTLVSSIPLMSEIMPNARATLMGMNIAAVSIGRALGALLASPIYSLGSTSSSMPSLLPSALAVGGLNLLALVALRRMKEWDKGLAAGQFSPPDPFS